MTSIKVKTKYDNVMLKQFFKYHYQKINWTTLILGLLMVVVGAILTFWNNTYSGVVLLILGVLIELFPLVAIYISLRANKKALKQEDEIEFKDNLMHVVSRVNGEDVINQDIKYIALHKLAEDSHNLYLYTNKASALIVSKSSLNNKEYETIVQTIKPILDSASKK